jgi:Fic family protein
MSRKYQNAAHELEIQRSAMGLAARGGFLGGLNAEKYMKMTGVSKATATRDLSEMTTAGQLRAHGVGKAMRYYVDVPGWTHGIS